MKEKSKSTKHNYRYQTLAAVSVVFSVIAIMIDILGIAYFKEHDIIMMSEFCLSYEVVIVAICTMLILIAALLMSGKRNVLSGVSSICTAATYISFLGAVAHTLYYLLIWIKYSKLIELLETIPIF